MPTDSGRKIGYARVSTGGQSLAAQLDALKAAGCDPIFKEKISGARDDRPQLNKLLGQLEPGDVVIVSRLDRLARSIFGLFDIVRRITEAKAHFRSINEAMIATDTPTGKMMLTMLGAMGEWERDMIKARTMEGRARAVANGRKMGPHFKLNPDQRREALRRRDEEHDSPSVIAKTFNVSRMTIARLRP